MSETDYGEENTDEEKDPTPLKSIFLDRFGRDRWNSITDEGLALLKEVYREKYEQFGSELQAFALAKNEFNFEKHSASTDTIRDNAIGCNGPRPFGDQQAVMIYGVAVPEDDPMGPIVVLVLEEDVESMPLEDIARQFSEFGEPFDLDVSLRPADHVSDGYIGEIADGTEFEECFEPASADDTAPEGERVDRIEQVTDPVEIFNIGDGLSMTGENNEYVADFGLDIKRIDNAVIQSAQVSAKGARYEIHDQSFFEVSELDETVLGTEDKSAGLVGWADPHVLSVKRESFFDSLFGTVEVKDGQGRVEISIIGGNPNNVKQDTVPEETEEETTSASGREQEERMI